MREDTTVAPVAQSLLKRQLFFGMPPFAAVLIGGIGFEFTLILGQLILGPLITIVAVTACQFMAKQDPYFFEIWTAKFRFKKVLK